MALLDRNSLSGAVRFHKQAQKSGVRAIIGAEVVAAEGFRYALLAESRQGYQNLCRLLTKIKLRTGHGDQEGCCCYCLKTLRNMRHQAGFLVSAVNGWADGRDLWAGNVFIEVQRHYDRDEEHRNQAAIAIARKLQLPLVATNGVSHAMEDERDLLDALTCVRHKTTIFEAGKLLAKNAERHLKSAAQMCKLFADFAGGCARIHREPGGAAANSRFAIWVRMGFRRTQCHPGETSDCFTCANLPDEGARRRYRPCEEKAQRQIERELAMIEKLNLAGYF